MKKVLGCTSIRSDYDIMAPLYRALNADAEIDFRILVSGDHLSSRSSHAFDQVKADGLISILELETLLNSDTGLARAKSAGLLLQNSLEIIAAFEPDLIIFGGDREDVLIYAFIGNYLNIPTAHFYAGDHAQDGYVDNVIRHAASKLSTAQFVAMEEHKQRLLSIGESADTIYVVGSLSIDNITGCDFLAKEYVKRDFNVPENFDNFALVIFHPITQELDCAGEYLENILLALKAENIFGFVSYPNTDPGSNRLEAVIEKYKDSGGFYFYKNLERTAFLSVYKNSSFIIGNSSSGLHESSTLAVPAVNVGARQRGRVCGSNVIFSDGDRTSIEKAVKAAMSEEFALQWEGSVNPYGDGRAVERCMDIIKTTEFSSLVQAKIDPLGS